MFVPTGIRQLPGRYVWNIFCALLESINEHLSVLFRELQRQLFSRVSQKRDWYVLFRVIPLNVMARSRELVTTVAFCTLLCLALPMLHLYWAASTAPWLLWSYLGFTAHSWIPSWYCSNRGCITYSCCPELPLTVPVWDRTRTGEHRQKNTDMRCFITFPPPAPQSWESSSKHESPNLGFWAIAGYTFPVALL